MRDRAYLFVRTIGGGMILRMTQLLLSPQVLATKTCFYFFRMIQQHTMKELEPTSLLLTIWLSRWASKDSRKEVFQPHLPVRLPCYDLAPVTNFALGRSLRLRTSGTLGSHGLTGGVYKARERIHRAMADARLLANPASRSRVADFDPN
jgi:hypothetical protein